MDVHGSAAALAAGPGSESPSVILSLNASASYVGMGSGAAIGGLVLHAASVPALGWVGGFCEVFALVVLVLSTHLQRKRVVGSKPGSNMADDERQGRATPHPDQAVPS